MIPLIILALFFSACGNVTAISALGASVDASRADVEATEPDGGPTQPVIEPPYAVDAGALGSADTTSDAPKEAGQADSVGGTVLPPCPATTRYGFDCAAVASQCTCTCMVNAWPCP